MLADIHIIKYTYSHSLDINECNLGEDDCHAQATCTDTTGGFDCACNSGYSGDGKSCTGSYMYKK